jgi:hypothetical protein
MGFPILPNSVFGIDPKDEPDIFNALPLSMRALPKLMPDKIEPNKLDRLPISSMPLSIRGALPKLTPDEEMEGYRPGGEAYDNRNKRLPLFMPLSVNSKPDEHTGTPLSLRAGLMGNSKPQAPQSQKVKPGKTNLQRRDLYKVDFPVSKSLSAQVGVAPSGNIMKRIKDPHIDKEKDMVYLGLNYHF